MKLTVAVDSGLEVKNSLLYFKVSSRGFWERQKRTDEVISCTFSLPFPPTWKRCWDKMANIISVERRLYFFYSLRQHMEAIRDQRGSVLSSRRTHKGLSLHNTMKTSVKCVWRKFHRAVCNRCDRFVHSSMESQRIMMSLWVMGAAIQERCLQV